MTKWMHFSREPLEGLYPLAQEGPSFKPRGLWLSDESSDEGWLPWCKTERYRLDRLRYCTPVRFGPGVNLLRLSTPEDLLRFTQEYRRPGSPTRYFEMDWARLASRYQGILITPYQWSLHMSEQTLWYYTWDCASGCIWDPAGVTLGEPVEVGLEETESAQA